MKVLYVGTGDELLSGDVVDSNPQWLHQQAEKIGVDLYKMIIVKDDLDSLISCFKYASETEKVVIVTGGLGPTEDDLTVEAAANFAGLPVIRSREYEEKLANIVNESGLSVSSSFYKQADIPEGAELINNKIGHARGFSMVVNECQFFFIPGMPIEFKAMVLETIFLALKDNYTLGPAYDVKWLRTFGLAESVVSRLIGGINVPEQCDRGVLIRLPFIETKLRYPISEEAIASRHFDEILKSLGDFVVCANCTLEEKLEQLVQEKGLQFSLYEGATKGELFNHLKKSDTLQRAVKHVSFDDLDMKSSTNSDQHVTICTKFDGGSNRQALASVVVGSLAVRVRIRALCYYSDTGFSTLISVVVLDIVRRLLSGLTAVGEYKSADYQVEKVADFSR